MTTSVAIQAAAVWTQRYRAMGYQPLPSDPERKKPLVRFAKHWESIGPHEEWDRFETTNIQVMTGRHWRLAVLDLDGPEAIEHVRSSWPRLPRTWKVWHSDGGSGSCHYWFGLAGAGYRPRRKSLLWGRWDDSMNEGRGGWTPRCAVELLFDRSLIMAPPSIHPKSGNAYGFEVGPKQMRRPAPLPDWIWRMKSIQAPRTALPPQAPRERRAVARVGGRHVQVQDMMAAIPDKVAVARSWGLRFARSLAESDGWVSCHDYNRDDKNPSARFHVESGAFWRPGESIVPMCKLAVELGCYGTWQECCDDLAQQYLTRAR